MIDSGKAALMRIGWRANGGKDELTSTDVKPFMQRTSCCDALMIRYLLMVAGESQPYEPAHQHTRQSYAHRDFP